MGKVPAMAWSAGCRIGYRLLLQAQSEGEYRRAASCPFKSEESVPYSGFLASRAGTLIPARLGNVVGAQTAAGRPPALERATSHRPDPYPNAHVVDAHERQC